MTFAPLLFPKTETISGIDLLLLNVIFKKSPISVILPFPFSQEH